MRMFFLIAFAATLLQCSDEEVAKETEVSCKLVRQPYAQISYDDNGKVTTVEQLDANNETLASGYKREFKYDINGELIRIDEYHNMGESLARYFLFEYSSNQILQKEYFITNGDDDELVDYIITYSLNSEGKVVQLDHESWNLNEPFTQVYEYENSNVKKVMRTSASSTDNYIIEYEFDDYLNPASIEKFRLNSDDVLFSFTTQNTNNIVKRTFIRDGSAPEVTTYTYNYNSYRYPTELFTNGSSTPSGFFEYECE
jgi:hypothetical protein